MRQIFKFKNTKGETFYFQTSINGEGYYNEINNTILGMIYDAKGKAIMPTRINFSRLVPVNYTRVAEIFPVIEENPLDSFCFSAKY